MITVAIDVEHTRQSRAGHTRYSKSLIGALRKRNDINAIEVGGGPYTSRGTLRKRLVTARQDFVWYPWLGRRRARAMGADVYHCPTLRAPFRRDKLPLVVTVADLVPVLYPETMTPWSRVYSRATLRRILDAADLLTAISQNTADDLNRVLRIPPERIRVVLLGVDDIFFSRLPASASEVPTPYVLFVGTPEPRKNLHRLVQAMTKLRTRGFPHRLVIAGGGGWGHVHVDSDQAELVGRVSDKHLHQLYAHAGCLVLPSLHEGFGLPAVEAMAAGTPVVTSRAGALPEVTGDAAVLVNPYDHEAIAAGIERALSEREKLIAAGRERARGFTWDRSAQAMAKVYAELV
ncbi:MAG: glycosyltransferase family 1 protein [Gemmatimonadaceae bacterium]